MLADEGGEDDNDSLPFGEELRGLKPWEEWKDWQVAHIDYEKLRKLFQQCGADKQEAMEYCFKVCDEKYVDADFISDPADIVNKDDPLLHKGYARTPLMLDATQKAVAQYVAAGVLEEDVNGECTVWFSPIVSPKSSG